MIDPKAQSAATRLLTGREVAGYLRIHAKTVKKWSAEGRLPRPVRIGGKMLRWREADIKQHIEDAST